jgi:hypothetical protein
MKVVLFVYVSGTGTDGTEKGSLMLLRSDFTGGREGFFCIQKLCPSSRVS